MGLSVVLSLMSYVELERACNLLIASGIVFLSFVDLL